MKRVIIFSLIAILILLGCFIFYFVKNKTTDNKPEISTAPSNQYTNENNIKPETENITDNKTATQETFNKDTFDITYCSIDGVELKLDIYYPKIIDKPLPAIVYVHGGGWVKGDKTNGGGLSYLKPEFINRGYLFISINYRLMPAYKFPAQIEDVKCAIRFLRANAKQFNLNPDRIGALGISAGGHLVSLLGTTDVNDGFRKGNNLDKSDRVQAVVDMCGPVDLRKFYGKDMYSTDEETLRIASPVIYVSKDDPPFLILHGDKDETVPLDQSQEFYQVLNNVGVPSEMVIVKNANHIFESVGGKMNPERFEIVQMIGDFFDKYLK